MHGFRLKGKENFTYRDVFVMDLLKEHMAYRVNKEMEKHQKNHDKLGIQDVVARCKLTQREHDTLICLMQGLKNEEICERLYITNNTLKKHILNVYRKVGVNSRVQLFKKVKEE